MGKKGRTGREKLMRVGSRRERTKKERVGEITKQKKAQSVFDARTSPL